MNLVCIQQNYLLRHRWSRPPGHPETHIYLYRHIHTHTRAHTHTHRDNTHTHTQPTHTRTDTQTHRHTDTNTNTGASRRSVSASASTSTSTIARTSARCQDRGYHDSCEVSHSEHSACFTWKPNQPSTALSFVGLETPTFVCRRTPACRTYGRTDAHAHGAQYEHPCSFVPACASSSLFIFSVRLSRTSPA